MIYSKQLNLHWEVLRWMAILSLAVATAMLFAESLGGGA